MDKGREVGPFRLFQAMTSKNACKTCALGMGGQQGGMRNETGHFPEVCKKSLQAMAADMQGAIQPEFWAKYSIAELQTLSPRDLEHMGRLSQPVIAEPGSTHYRPVTWEVALDHIAGSMTSTAPERAFFYASGRSSNEAGFLLHVLARAYGSNHVNNCSFYCHQASGVGLYDSIGSGTATVRLEDLDECDLVFLIGGNPASNHPRLMTTLAKLRDRGGHVVVVNPLRETGLVNFRVPSQFKSLLLGTEIASIYVQPTIGGDIAFLVGVLKRLLEKCHVDELYLNASTEAFDSVRELAETTPWNDIVALSGVDKSQIDKVAALYAESSGTVFAWTMGITHHEHGVDNVHWIVNLALARGMVGKSGAGLLPIRGHSNVQGIGTVGVHPGMSRAAAAKLGDLGIPEPQHRGHDTLAALEASNDGEFDFGLCLGGNLYGASPDAQFVKGALSRLDTLVYLSTTLNTGHVHGLGATTIILPVLARDEEPQSTTQESMFSFVRLSEGGEPRHEGLKSESEVLAKLGQRVLEPSDKLNWTDLEDHDTIRRLISHLVPQLAEIAEIGTTKREFHIPGRHFEHAVFPTATGKATMKACPIPRPLELRDDELRLMTIRSEGQFNTVVYEDQDIYRGQERRDVVLLNSADMLRLGLEEDDRVDLSSSAGEMNGLLVRAFEIARGCAAVYYPESNVLVPRDRDDRSKTPAFKSIVVRVKPSAP